jgi:hypothetical protein
LTMSFYAEMTREPLWEPLVPCRVPEQMTTDR